MDLTLQEWRLEQARSIEEPYVYRGMGNQGSDVERWRWLVAEYWPAELVDWALCAISWESGGNPNAKHVRSSVRGLFQIRASVWAEPFGIEYDDLYDPELNVQLAYRIYEIQGKEAWMAYNRGICP